MKQIIYVLTAIIMIASANAMSDMCDMNGDGNINEEDYNLFEEVRQVMDLNNDDNNDIADFAIWASKYQTPNWCYDELRTYWETTISEATQNKGSRLRIDKVKNYLFGEFLTFLDSLFVTHEEQAHNTAKILLGFDADKDKIDCKTSLLMSEETGERYTYNGWISKPGSTKCMKFN